MNLASWLVLVLLSAAVVAAVIWMRRSRCHSGRGGCSSSGCDGCSLAGSCSKSKPSGR